MHRLNIHILRLKPMDDGSEFYTATQRRQRRQMVIFIRVHSFVTFCMSLSAIFSAITYIRMHIYGVAALAGVLWYSLHSLMVTDQCLQSKLAALVNLTLCILACLYLTNILRWPEYNRTGVIETQLFKKFYHWMFIPALTVISFIEVLARMGCRCYKQRRNPL
ncbi:hypothetical protein ACOME3_010314 [Neoechinorhynchus agilis]